MTGIAPAKAAPMHAFNPIPPVPNTTTVSPAATRATLNIAPMPVGAAQPSKIATSIAMPGGNSVTRFSLTAA